MLLEHLEHALKSQPGKRELNLRDAAQAAVAVLVRPNLDVLFIRRAEYEGDPWSGHIALPGGRVDASDADPEHAARREVFEEVGVDLVGSHLLGMLDQVASPDLAPRVVVSPYVYALDSDPTLTLDSTEVADVHWFGLERLLSGEGRGTFDYDYHGRSFELPRLDLDGARIWGMTLRIVDDIVTRLRADL